ncbi:hypothetical protein AHF37_05663 [Paragonimus kellicotti]|nr:hypothetical protein AHF37_05663 [Paragonimus kellicotti]
MHLLVTFDWCAFFLSNSFIVIPLFSIQGY